MGSSALNGGGSERLGREGTNCKPRWDPCWDAAAAGLRLGAGHGSLAWNWSGEAEGVQPL